MKKWYVITGILALLLLVSLCGCSSGKLKAELASANYQLSKSRAELASTKARLSDEATKRNDAETELAKLKAQGITFGIGLKVFDVDLDTGFLSGVRGKVQNTSSEPMKKVVIMVAFYYKGGKSGETVYVSTDSVSDLFPGEVGNWTTSAGGYLGEEWDSFDVYAIGSKR